MQETSSCARGKDRGWGFERLNQVVAAKEGTQQRWSENDTRKA